MAITIVDLTPGFGGEVSGIDITRPLTRAQADALEAGMDRYAVLVYHDQRFTDEQQKDFSRNFGALEQTPGGNITAPADRRLDMEMADVSNLGADHQPLARDDRRRLFNLGNQLWHSDSSFRAIPAKYSLLSGRIVVDDGGNTEFADMRAAYDALDAEDQGRNRGSGLRTLADLFARHAGFRRADGRGEADVHPGAPAPGADASGDRAEVAVPVLAYRHDRRLAGAGGAGLHPRPDGTCDAASVRLCAQVAPLRSGDVGQPDDDAPGRGASMKPWCGTCGAPPWLARA